MGVRGLTARGASIGGGGVGVGEWDGAIGWGRAEDTGEEVGGVLRRVSVPAGKVYTVADIATV